MYIGMSPIPIRTYVKYTNTRVYTSVYTNIHTYASRVPITRTPLRTSIVHVCPPVQSRAHVDLYVHGRHTSSPGPSSSTEEVGPEGRSCGVVGGRDSGRGSSPVRSGLSLSSPECLDSSRKRKSISGNVSSTGRNSCLSSGNASTASVCVVVFVGSTMCVRSRA